VFGDQDYSGRYSPSSTASSTAAARAASHIIKRGAITIRAAAMKEQGFSSSRPRSEQHRAPKARETRVPVRRLHPGKFYALPQRRSSFSSRHDFGLRPRYFQIAAVLRDEDARCGTVRRRVLPDRHRNELVTQETCSAAVEPVLRGVSRSSRTAAGGREVSADCLCGGDAAQLGSGKPGPAHTIRMQDVTAHLRGPRKCSRHDSVPSGSRVVWAIPRPRAGQPRVLRPA